MAKNGRSDGFRALLLRLGLALSPLLLVGVCVRWYGLGWGPVHRVREPTAVLHPDLQSALREKARDVHDADDAESAALSLTDDLLYFGFRHRTDLHFEHARQANSGEYAELFAVAFNQLAQTAKLTAHAQVVRSSPTSLMGVAPTHSAMQSHEWVVIADGTQRRYVDPTLHDAWLGEDVSRNVQGAVEIRAATRGQPRRADPQARPERIPNRAPHVSTLQRAERKREQEKAPAGSRSSEALRMFDKLGVSLP